MLEFICQKEKETLWLIKNNIATLYHDPIHLLENNEDEIDWNNLSSNKNACHLLELCKSPSLLDWPALCRNPSAMPYITKHYKYIHWPALSSNPSAVIMESSKKLRQ